VSPTPRNRPLVPYFVWLPGLLALTLAGASFACSCLLARSLAEKACEGEPARERERTAAAASAEALACWLAFVVVSGDGGAIDVLNAQGAILHGQKGEEGEEEREESERD